MLASKDDLTKIGYDIGWDMYIYGMTPQDSAAEDKNIMAGFAEAKSRRPSTKETDRYERKCLTLRMNAYLRGKAFDDRICPEYLMFIDVAYCPVTNVRLTHGTLTDSDWSVDRIHNEAGYTIGNLVVVSTKANRAKGSYSYKDIKAGVEYIRENPGTKSELSLYEWMRWESILSRCIPVTLLDKDDSISGIKMGSGEATKYTEDFVTAIAPCVVRPPPGISSSPSDTFQLAISTAAMRGRNVIKEKVIPEFRKLITPEHNLLLDKIIKSATRILEKNPTFNPIDIWYNEALFQKYTEFINADYGDFEPHKVISLMLQAVEKFDLDNDDPVDQIMAGFIRLDTWHTDTGGKIKM